MTLPTAVSRPTVGRAPARQAFRRWRSSPYPVWFYLPAAILYLTLFIAPTFMSFFFSLTRWTLFDWQFIGLENFRQFFAEPGLVASLGNTFLYAGITAAAKVVIGMALGLLLTSAVIGRTLLRSLVFFPVLVSTIGVGITFKVLMHPTDGLINTTLSFFGIAGPGWLTDPHLALISVTIVDVWKGVGLATVIYMAGIVSISSDYRDAAMVDGAGAWNRFRHITLPLLRPATSTVLLLAFIGGLRSFELIWAMTGGGPGFASDVLASVIYKQYQAGFYGLSTAGNVVLFIVVAAIAFPLNHYLNKREVDR
ncbi:carbohydrate ABC transporter permease [Microbacterium immunditiarum]|uniref:Raffinose/stachyose/melibiose transport system permease protein n=1 Tax=Microbacterium immunditiarum TaxID=337480 RepID=A0A7Y9GK80_9MICO|nr:sugar ABC transporter permease [Microbacterium immunditiarum]NYE18043.1 raffinose/stachyose/melibiose transport system permease protein [Microbacterium immunditiarum]